MLARDLFWFAAGLLAALAGMLVAVPLLRRAPGEAGVSTTRQLALGAAVLGSIAAAAVGLYAWVGTPAALDNAARGAGQAPHSVAPPGAAAEASSLENATERLAARLAAGGGTRDEWNLLAQSYDFMGRAAEAEQARRQAELMAGSGAAAPAGNLDPEDQRLVARAEALRRQRDFSGAVAIYAGLAERGVLDADGWANYADAAATAQGHLSGEAARFIDEALRLDPGHPKALWLKASLAVEEERYADAVPLWTQLAQVLPPDSSDQRIIAANLAESARRAEQGAGFSSQQKISPAPSSGPGRIEGTVDLDPSLRARARDGATLFIYARQIGAGGPPLAVLRVTAGTWPLPFVLDDSNAMMPGRTISSQDKVQLDARISLSGNATPQSGDLAGTINSVDPRAGKPVRIVIDRVIS